MSLGHQDVQEILRLLDDTTYDSFTLQTGGFTLTLQRGSDGKGWQQETQTRLQQGAAQAVTESNVVVTEPPASEPGLLDIRAPMVGTFYRAPKPGAEPYVQIGSRVDSDTVIAIIEVMKLMSAVPARTSGVIAEILVEDARSVEKGQLLMRVRPPSR